MMPMEFLEKVHTKALEMPMVVFFKQVAIQATEQEINMAFIARPLVGVIVMQVISLEMLLLQVH